MESRAGGSGCGRPGARGWHLTPSRGQKGPCRTNTSTSMGPIHGEMQSTGKRWMAFVRLYHLLSTCVLQQMPTLPHPRLLQDRSPGGSFAE